MLLGEDGPNGKVGYLTDALGSVVTTVNKSGTVLNEYRYKPYGAQLSKSGTAPDPAFTWAGVEGYRQTGLNHADSYIRKRHYSSLESRWVTVDSLWPEASQYGYVGGRPTNQADYSGNATISCCICVTSLQITVTAFTCIPPNKAEGCVAPLTFNCGNGLPYSCFNQPGWFGWNYVVTVTSSYATPPKGSPGGAWSLKYSETLSYPGFLQTNNGNSGWACLTSNNARGSGCTTTSSAPCSGSSTCTLPDCPGYHCKSSATPWYYSMKNSISITQPKNCNCPSIPPVSGSFYEEWWSGCTSNGNFAPPNLSSATTS
jgi:RHS repeat-associated protein